VRDFELVKLDAHQVAAEAHAAATRLRSRAGI
jgi:hypothetical protein